MASLIELINEIQTEADAYIYLEKMRWPDGVPPACPHCGSSDRPPLFLKPQDGSTGRKTRTGSISQRRVWKCRDSGCRKQFSVLTNTPMHGTKIPVRTWVLVTFEMCSSKNGVSAREIERKYGLSPKSAWFLLHRIREGMSDPEPPQWEDATVVVDETYIGPKVGRMNNKAKKQHYERHQTARGTTAPDAGKTEVVTLINRESGQVYSRVVNNVTRGSAAKHVYEVTNDISTIDLYTDGAQHFKGVGKDARSHEAADHAKGEYVTKNGGGTNPVEAFFSQFKRSLDGTQHHVSRVHLQRYLDEFGFRHWTRQMKDAERLATYYKGLFGKRLTYRPVQQGNALAG